VLVRVIYAGVNPVETYIREGQYSRLPDLPYIPGSGTVSAHTVFTVGLVQMLFVIKCA
jgi:NADPH:quinone reductase-like Zn-dependent oxidoreductase